LCVKYHPKFVKMIKIRLNKNYMWSSVNNGNNNNNYYRLLKNTKINIYFDYHNI